MTVVISPLQSLMKDQVDNLEKAGITDAVTINGLLDPIERAKSFEKSRWLCFHIIYLAGIFTVKDYRTSAAGEKCGPLCYRRSSLFSSWGQDFRVDYLYIGDFIKSLQERKNSEDGIPVSCFTATAK